MKSESTIINFIENFPVPASLKEADTGKYIFNNTHNLRQFGVNHPSDVVGLTIQDLNFRQPEWGALYAQSIEKLDFSARENKSHAMSRHPFLANCGYAQMEEMTKFPVLGFKGNILGIVTYRRDITRTLPPISIFRLYRNFYNATDAIKRVAIFLGIERYFLNPPTETQFHVLLLKSERFTNKEISSFLGISDRTVECHCTALRNKVIDGNLPYVLSLVKKNTSFHATEI